MKRFDPDFDFEELLDGRGMLEVVDGEYTLYTEAMSTVEAAVESARAECRERIEKLEKVAQYAEHSLTCGCSYISPDEPCTCGLKTARAAAGV